MRIGNIIVPVERTEEWLVNLLSQFITSSYATLNLTYRLLAENGLTCTVHDIYNESLRWTDKKPYKPNLLEN